MRKDEARPEKSLPMFQLKGTQVSFNPGPAHVRVGPQMRPSSLSGHQSIRVKSSQTAVGQVKLHKWQIMTVPRGEVCFCGLSWIKPSPDGRFTVYSCTSRALFRIEAILTYRKCLVAAREEPVRTWVKKGPCKVDW